MLNNNVLTSFRLMLENGLIIQLIKNILDGRIGVNKEYYTSKEIDNQLSLQEANIVRSIHSKLNNEVLEYVNVLTTASVAETKALLIDNKAVSPEGLQSVLADGNNYGLGRFANHIETSTGNDIPKDKMMSIIDIRNRKASDTIYGLAKFPTDDELNNLLNLVDSDIMLSPYSLNKLINKYMGYIDPNHDYDRIEEESDGTHSKDDPVYTPIYVVGSGLLEVYMNGLLCSEGDQYIEVGEVGTESNTIYFLDDIPAGYRIVLIVNYPSN